MKHKKAAVLGIFIVCIFAFGIWTRFQGRAEKIGIKGVNLQRTGAYNQKGISNTAEVKWQQLLPFNLGVRDFMLYDDYLVYASSEEIVAFNKENKKEEWRINGGDKNAGNNAAYANYGFSNIVISQDILYYTADNKVIGVNIHNGKQVWTYEITDEVKLGSPVVSKGVIYFGSGKGKLHAVNISSKQEKWSIDTSSIPENITLDNNNVYCSDRLNVYSISAIKGEKNWEKTFPDASQLIIDEKNIYFKYLNYPTGLTESRVEGYKLVSLSKKNGDKNWDKQFIAESLISSDIVLYEGKLYYTDFIPVYGDITSIEDSFGRNHVIHALSCKDGSEVWKVERYDKHLTGLSASDGELYVAVGDKTLRKISMEDGSEASKYKMDYQVMMTTVFKKEKMYFIGINFSESIGSVDYYIGLME